MIRLSQFLDDLQFFYRDDSPFFMTKNLALASEENDKFILKALMCYWLTSLGITLYFDTYMLGLVAGSLINGLAWIGYKFLLGIYRRFVFCICLCLFSALFIHQQPGYVEPHFSFYASVYMLTRYKDVRPLLFFACLTVLYYLVFTYLQSKSVSIFGINVDLFTWGLWDAFRFHVIAFLGASLVFAVIIRNHIVDFKKSQLLLLSLSDKKHGLKNDIASRTQLLSKKTKKLKTILNSLSEGLLMINQDKCIHKQYSAFLETILDKKNLAGKPAVEVLFKDSNLTLNDIENVKKLLDISFGKDSQFFESNMHLLVKHYSIMTEQGNKYLQIQWSPICNKSGELEQILVSVVDRSQFKKLQKKTEKNIRELQGIDEVLKIEQQVFSKLMNDAYSIIKYSVELTTQSTNKQAAIIEEILLILHDIKNRSWTSGLVRLAKKVQDIEIYTGNFNNEDALWDFKELSNKLLSLLDIISDYNLLNSKLRRASNKPVKGEWLVDKKSVESLLNQISTTEHSTEEDVIRSLFTAKAYFSALGAQSVKQIIQPIIASLNNFADKLGKLEPEFEIQQGDILLSSFVVENVSRAITHIMRNSVLHGIEISEQRSAKYKLERGKITCRCELTENGLLIHIFDDGQGLNLASIRDNAIFCGLLLNTQSVSDEFIANIVFEAMYSNITAKSEVAERSVSLYAIKKQLKSSNIDISVKLLCTSTENNSNRAFEIQLFLPAKLLQQNNKWVTP